ncbi:MAG: insulinase family protein [Lachnospiraceae bacterium]|nr:insulinase family protein [Lachnospiraceae bacterium]
MRDLGTLQHEAYERLYGERLTEYKSDGLVLRHKKSGAAVCLVSNDDEQKVFAIGFRTIPYDDTGVAHILEHSVLCGSRKYPLKDPFVELLKGSMQTFLNAFTYPDKTIYPVASCNDQDFRNLVDVYMDAVLHPNIYDRKEIFLQEGWRYHLEDRDDPVTLNGVVYSEMKGAFSDPESVLYRVTKKSMFPDNTYRTESGGDPEVIPSLTYEKFLDFHRKYYHPGNSVIYLYGDMNMYEYLDYLDREYLSDYDLGEAVSIEDQKPAGILEKTYDYPISDSEDEGDKSYFVLATMSVERELEKEIAWNAVTSTLFDRTGAPVKQALIDAGIGTDIIDYTDIDLKQPMFVLYAKGADATRRDDFFELLFKEIEKELKKGLNKKAILGYLTGVEFMYREMVSDNMPKGLGLGCTIMCEMMYDQKKAFRACRSIAACKKLRAKVDTDYFEKIAEEVLLSHKHEVRLVMNPKKGIDKEQEEALAKKLEEFKAGLSEAEIDALVAQTKALREYQEAPETPEALESIPMLKRSDLTREIRRYPLNQAEINGIPVYHFDTNLPGITYLQLMIDVTDLPKEEVPYLGLFATLLLEVDTKQHSYSDLSDEMHLHIGDLYSSIYGVMTEQNHHEFRAVLKHTMKALTEEMPVALGFFTEMLTDTLFEDKKRILDVIRERRGGMRSGVISAGHTAALKRCQSYFCECDMFIQDANRLGQYEFLCDCIDHYEDDADEIMRHLYGIMAYTLDQKRFKIGLFATPEDYETVMKMLPDTLSKLRPDPSVDAPKPAEKLPWEGGYTLRKTNEAYTFASKVNYVAAAGCYKDAGFEEKGSLQVLNTILSREYLWQNVRVKGGAYGCRAAHTSAMGSLGFVSFRDPSIGKTYDVYHAIPDYVRNLELGERELTKYVIGTISVMDAPMSPMVQGETAVNYILGGRDPERAQKIRNEILDVTEDELRSHADMIETVLKQGFVCCFGSESAIEKEKDLFLEVKPLR